MLRQIQAAEDLLSLSRTLKEAWLFGKLQTVGTSEAEKRTEAASAEVLEKLNELRAKGVFNPVKNSQSEERTAGGEASTEREGGKEEGQDVTMT